MNTFQIFDFEGEASLKNSNRKRSRKIGSGSLPPRKCTRFHAENEGVLLNPGKIVPKMKQNAVDLVSVCIDNFNRSLDPNYSQDIHDTHRENEESLWKEIKCTIEDVQPEVDHKMRAILVDWLIEVAQEYSLKSETLFLTVNYVDRVLEAVPVTRSTLQLVGCTCMLLAAKYEEVQVPLVDDFVSITDNAYSREEILQTELIVLNTLNFKLTVSTIKNFLMRFLLLHNDVKDMMVVHLADYLAEMVLPFYFFHRKYRPSQIAAAIACIAKHTFNLPSWSSTFEAYSQYTKNDLSQCIHEIFHIHGVLSVAAEGEPMTAARQKYRQENFGCVANIPLLSPNIF